MEGIMILWVIVILWVVVFITKEIKLRLSKCPKCTQTGATRQTITSSKARYKVFLQCNACGHSYNISYKTKSNDGDGDNYGSDSYGGGGE